MTTQEFITKAFNGQTKKTSCSSVFAESNGDVYSYGYHYPLLFRVAGKAIRNVTGYSNTTAKHIQWSRGVDAIDIHCGGYFRLVGNDIDTLTRLVNAQQAYIDSIQAQMDSKKRKDTQVYKWLQFDHDRAVENLNKLQAEV